MMSTNELKKSYKLLVVWFAAYIAMAILFSLIFSDFVFLDQKMTNMLWLLYVYGFIISLLIMILKTERVYYINYISFKEAQDATSEERKEFALKHIKTLSVGLTVFLIYCVASLTLKWHSSLDVLVFSSTVIIAGLRTIPYRLKKK